MTTTASSEELVWQGHPSHVTAFLLHACALTCLVTLLASGAVLWQRFQNPPGAVACLVGALLVLGTSFWNWLKVRSIRYEVTTERLKTTTGILTRRLESLELYRVRDLSVVQPFWYRIWGKGNVVLQTSDPTTPQVTLLAVPDPEGLRDRLRQHIERCRQQKRAFVTEIDGESLPPNPER